MATVGYIRVSTLHQVEEGVSLEAQKKKVRAYCELHDLDLAEIVSDEGISAKTIAGRPGIQRVLEMVKANRVDNVVIFKLDRLCRNLREACEIVELFKVKKVALHSVSEKIDTGSAMGKFFYQIIAAIAEWERETISERTRLAMATKKAKGERISLHAPLGFMHKESNVVKDTAEQEIIARVMEYRRQGLSIRKIVQYLREEGVTSRSGGGIHKSAVQRILERTA